MITSPPSPTLQNTDGTDKVTYKGESQTQIYLLVRTVTLILV